MAETPATRSLFASAGNTHPVCVCGHPRDWHSRGGMGDCEHDGDCGCKAFRRMPLHEALPRIVELATQAVADLDQLREDAIREVLSGTASRDLIRRNVELQAINAQVVRHAEAAEAANEALKAALTEYGWHKIDPVCDAIKVPPAGPCTCGFDKVLHHDENERPDLLHRLKGLESVRRCNDPMPTGDGTQLCDLWPDHDGPHVNAETSSEWKSRV